MSATDGSEFIPELNAALQAEREAKPSVFPTGFAYVVECRTGCTCCADENHYRGPYKTIIEAQRAVDGFRSIKLLASQYAANGVYNIERRDCEVLPDGRLIVGDHVLAGYCEDTGDDYIGSSL